LTISAKGAKIFGGSPNFLMPQRDKIPPSGPKPSKIPFVMRTSAMGSSGWEGYTVGFTLVGCVLGGAGAGYLLDSHFKTGYWLPILFLVGVIGGFREVWIIIKRVEAQENQKRRDKTASTPLATPPVQQGASGEPLPERKRIFQVPPPPFEPGSAPDGKRTGESSEDILKRLLAESDEQSDDADKR